MSSSSWLIWMLLAAGAALAGGYFLGRSSSAGVKRSMQLEEDLRASRAELERYRNDVVEHFTTTAQLVNKLTADYRAVYHHLARGAQDLAGGRTPQLEALSGPSAAQIELSPPPPAVDELLGDVEEEETRREQNARPQQQRVVRELPAEGWYDEDVAPGAEVPDFARDRRTGS